MGNQTMVTSAGKGCAGWGGGEASEVAGLLGAKSCRRAARGQELADDEREIGMGPLSSSFDSNIVAGSGGDEARTERKGIQLGAVKGAVQGLAAAAKEATGTDACSK